ncbi:MULTISPECIES: DUF305 domain-containing protein [unclassified Amycolatopsis]|uniref:DUF305 domain-containing protein n=1 Tax=unclassified Amycolatopsis TaxID=2618356 RepID=UPI001C69759E|nr:DUF305 domain-containing protein [Amycolatopsis sp. DSM 110486]QYN22600.1 DUF305 domain-containing protein [Amycolatopsis sp. DSM 110486]
MSTEADLEPDVDEPGERPTWSRWVVIGGSMLAVLLIGVAIGVFAARLTDGSDAAPATPGAGSVEVGFAQDMSTHHLQAVTMANWARDHSTDPEVRQLAFDIESSQTEQVGRMKGWLMLWDQPEQAPGAYMTWMTEPMGHAGMQMPTSSPANGAPMPGMATDAEIAKLRSLTGRAMDVDFLQLMLRHHQGGTAMAEYAQDHSNLPALKALCRSILVSQGAEINQMKLMLQARGAAPLPAS